MRLTLNMGKLKLKIYCSISIAPVKMNCLGIHLTKHKHNQYTENKMILKNQGRLHLMYKHACLWVGRQHSKDAKSF